MKTLLNKNRPFSFVAKFIFTLILLSTGCQNVYANEKQYQLTAENQSDASIITFDLQVESELTEIDINGKTFSYFENLTSFTKSIKKGFPEVLSKQAPVTVDPHLHYTLELLASEHTKYMLHPRSLLVVAS